MFVQSLPFFFLLSSLISFFTATRAWLRREVPAARTLALTLACAAAWILFDGLELAATNLPTTVFFAQMAYPFRLFTMVLLFRFSLEFTGQGHRVTRRLMILLSIIPIVAVLITFTNQWHHLNWSKTVWMADLNMVFYERGPWFWVQVTYIYGLFMLTCGILLRNSFRQRSLFRLQSLSVVVAALVPIASNAVYLLRLGPYPALDLTSIAFFVTGVLLNFSMTRFRFLDLMPLARHIVVEKMAEGVIILDSQYRVVDINPAALALLDLPKVEPGQVDWLPAWFPFPDQAFAETERGISTPNRELNVHCAPLTESGGTLHLGWLILVRDITERVRSESAMRALNDSLESQVIQRTAEIKQEHERTDAILHSIADALVTIDLAHCVTYVNDPFLKLTGYAPEQILGQPITLLGLDIASLFCPAPSPDPFDPGEQVRRKKAILTRQNGVSYPADVTVAPLRDPKGRVSGYVVSHTDRSQAQALDLARSRFITNISHEMRTPITNIGLYAQLLSNALQGGRVPDVQRYLATLQAQIRHFQSLIQDILTLAELDASQSIAPGLALENRQVLMPYEMIEEIFTRFHPVATQKGLSLSLDSLPQLVPALDGYRERLVLALGKMAENAIRYTSAPGKITLRLRTDNPGWVGFVVQDTGVGLSQKDREHAFDRFYRGEIADAGDVPGGGLGLTIALSIAKEHHGKIDLAGAVGEGAIVTLWLPAAQKRANEAEPQSIDPELPNPKDRPKFPKLSKPKQRPE